ncbi:serine protease [Flavivirga aquatica]|uniref:Serine protease n=1 Tax=Flavivirga aquatica TaxID=1849968 RepID=A0A1E5T8P3_9FLAO|nr:S8 family serine peptidase [Flavivirga aquatica]OEK07740.1 serine protease [Flavivirga aquatica]
MKKGILLLLLLGIIQFKVFAQQDAWVYLTDKENVEALIANPLNIITQKAIDRKNNHSISIDERDVPVNENYIAQLKNATGITVMAKSKWFNAVHVRGNQIDIEALNSLGFIDRIDFADKSLNVNSKSAEKKRNFRSQKKFKLESTLKTFNYGNAFNQIEMFNGDDLHVANYTGSGITIAVLDGGYLNVNVMTSFKRLRDAGNIKGSYDFVNRDIDVYTNAKSSHGTLVLSNMAGFVQDEYVGTAPDASYYLFITEDAINENPVEESYWVEAVERADSLGVDIINSSLGYTTYDNSNYSYTPADMNGNTAYITKGANIAFEKGMLIVNSAGNSGNDTWGTVGAPADASGVLSIGAVTASGNYASFSSRGTAIQSTQKPDVVAQGAANYAITEKDEIKTFNGTSFSSPTIAGGIACLWEALPNKTNAEIMQLVRESASQYTTPDYFLGYGIPDLEKSLNLALSTEANDFKSIAFDLFPNPVKETIHVKTPLNEAVIALRLFDILGNEINTFLISNENNTINMSLLPKGIYIAKVEIKGISKTFKLVKE